MKLVAVSAGLGVPSSSRLLADRLVTAVRRQTAESRIDVENVELRDLAVEIAQNLGNSYPGRALGAALDTVSAADGLIVVTPVFSASYSGLFKSFFDVLGRDALVGKPVLIAATGGTARHSLVLDHALRPLFTHLRAVVAPTGVYAASEDWGSPGLPERLGRAAGELARLMVPGLTPTPSSPGRTPAPDSDGKASPHGFRLVPFERQLAALHGEVTHEN